MSFLGLHSIKIFPLPFLHNARYTANTDMDFSSGAPRGGGTFSITSSPNNALAFTNCLIVNPSDFPDRTQVLVKQAYIMTTKYVCTYLTRSRVC